MPYHVTMRAIRRGDTCHTTWPGEHLAIFRSYDHLTKHLISGWTLSNCGAGKPFFAADDVSRQTFCQDSFGQTECEHHTGGDAGALWNLHRGANYPETNIISSGVVRNMAHLPDTALSVYVRCLIRHLPDMVGNT